MRCACVDIGTNTTRLLVAELDRGVLREVAALRRFLRLRPYEPGGIDRATVDELAATVAALIGIARVEGADRVRVVGTAAIRAAPRRDALCRVVAEAAGVPVEVLSPEDEARLAFAGATHALEDAPVRAVGVVDVGGGSSELVVGTLAHGATWSASIALGSGVLTDRHVRSDPPTRAEIGAMRAEVAEALGQIAAPTPERALAVGGSATSLRRLVGDELTGPALADALRALEAAPAAEVARAFDLHLERARLLPAGLVLLQAAAATLGDAPLEIARGGLREGVVLQDLAHGAAA